MSAALQNPLTDKKRRSFPHKAVWWMNIFAVFGLLLSYLAKQIPPEKVWWLALFGLGYGTLLLVNLVFVGLWLWIKSRKYLVSLSVCLVGIGNLFNIYEPDLFRTSAPDSTRYVRPIKVMSFNVRLFDLYNWFHNTETRDSIFRFLAAESPDVVCFQEFYTSENPKHPMHNRDTLFKVLRVSFAHVRYSVTLRQTDHWGIATFSRFPIVRKGQVRFDGRTNNVCLFSDVAVNEDTIRIFNVHLESIRFRKEDYRFIENLGKDEVDQDELAGGLNIIRRLKRAFVKRSRQVDKIESAVRTSPYPVLLCGDFNDTPTSYAVSSLSDELKDAFRESGTGFGKTYSGPFPSFRIDYIFHDKRIRSFGYRTHHGNLSDHFPISCNVTWKIRGL